MKQEFSKEEQVRYLKILVEGVLFKEVKGDKGNRQKLIEKFIENLPEYLQNIDNCKEIVNETLRKTEEETVKNEKRRFSNEAKIIKREEDRYGGKLPLPMFMRKNQDKQSGKDEEER